MEDARQNGIKILLKSNFYKFWFAVFFHLLSFSTKQSEKANLSIMDRQLLSQKLVEYYLSNKKIGVSVVFNTKHELKCQNELFLKYHFSGNTSVSVFITKIIWQTFDIIVDNP